jgi:spermidine synthase
VSAELIRDLDRPSAWWLLVDGSEQSFVDVVDPGHLEFEYLQMASHVVQTAWPPDDPPDAPLDLLHLGGGLCTFPRWVAARYPGARQLVVERSAAIAAMSRQLGAVAGTELVEADASSIVRARPDDSADIVVCDVYEGPETVTSLFTVDALTEVRRVLRADGCYVCNLSDASPFALAKVVVATVRATIGPVVMLAEPPVLRGRRSGNLVLAAGHRSLSLEDLVRRATSAPVRTRVVAGDLLDEFIAGAQPANAESDLPVSGETLGLRWS